MVDEGGVEVIAESTFGDRPPFITSSEHGYFYGVANVEHPKFGVVTMRLNARHSVDTFGSVKEREADFRTFVERCYEGIKEAARQE